MKWRRSPAQKPLRRKKNPEIQTVSIVSGYDRPGNAWESLTGTAPGERSPSGKAAHGAMPSSRCSGKDATTQAAETSALAAGEGGL